MRSGRILPRVREIEILRHEESAGSLSGGLHDVVIPPGEVLIRNRVDIVSEVGKKSDDLMRQVLVELDVHRTRVSATGRSSCAERG
jgi:hypothetical protein